MNTTILITGATDGIGLQTAKSLAAQGHNILLHGRNSDKLESALIEVQQVSQGKAVRGLLSDLSRISNVRSLADEILSITDGLDVLINNAGVFRSEETLSPDNLDLRFTVNTIAPALLTQRLIPIFRSGTRVINLSSAAQAPVDLGALSGSHTINDQLNAYAQSKLALTAWSRHMADIHKDYVFLAVNPGSLLATKMVREGFGMEGKDLTIGSDILVRAAIDTEFSAMSGKYFDNDSGQFASPHPDALNTEKCAQIANTINAVLEKLTEV